MNQEEKPKEVKKFPAQVGQSISCDFSESTWTFEMPKGFVFKGGKFSIVPVEDYESLQSKSDLLAEALGEAQKEFRYHNWQNTPTYNKVTEALTNYRNEVKGE